MSGGAIPTNRYKYSILVGLKHAVIALNAVFFQKDDLCNIINPHTKNTESRSENSMVRRQTFLNNNLIY